MLDTQAAVFVDTVAWIALLNVSDVLHAQALEIMDSLRRKRTRFVTTEFVLLAVADALSAPSIRTQTVGFIEGLRRLSVLRIVPLNQELLTEGWSLYAQRTDKDWGLTDCISFVVMNQEPLSQAFTSDHHFEQAGFINLLKK